MNSVGSNERLLHFPVPALAGVDGILVTPLRSHEKELWDFGDEATPAPERCFFSAAC